MNAAPRLLLSLAIFGWFAAAGSSESAEADGAGEDSDNAFFMDRRLKVEFLENVSRQTYLNQISYDDRFVLDLYMLDQNLKNENFMLRGEYPRACPRLIFLSMGLTGLANPVLRTGNIAICPNMRANCCTNNDFVGLDAVWKDYFAYLELNYDYFAHYAKISLHSAEEIAAQAEYLRKNSPHMICRTIGESFARFKAEEFGADKFIAQLARVKAYDLSLKKGFKCMLCDYDNNQFIDVENRVVRYRDDFCVDIAKNTFAFFTNLNEFFLRFFNSATMVARCSGNHGLVTEKLFPFNPEEAFDFLEVQASFYDVECRRALSTNRDEEIAVYCRHYCHKFDMWTFRGILPDVVKMGRMFATLAENLLPVQEIEALKPKDDVVNYAFPFETPSNDVFTQFEQVFGEHGVSPDNVKEPE